MKNEVKVRRQKKQSRRQFLWELGMGLAGLMGISKLVKAMTVELKPNVIAIPPVVPCIGGVACVPPAQPFYHCPALYNCGFGFQCGPSWLGDFECQNGFDCLGGGYPNVQFKCIGSEPGTQFECNIIFSCNGHPTYGLNAFWCDPGDFWCNLGPPNQYFCNAAPGGGYVQPPTGCKPLL